MQAFNQITLSDIASLTGQCDKIIIEKSNKHLPEVDDAWKLIRKRGFLTADEIICKTPLSDKHLDSISALINTLKSVAESVLRKNPFDATYKEIRIPPEEFICIGTGGKFNN